MNYLSNAIFCENIQMLSFKLSKYRKNKYKFEKKEQNLIIAEPLWSLRSWSQSKIAVSISQYLKWAKTEWYLVTVMTLWQTKGKEERKIS